MAKPGGGRKKAKRQTKKWQKKKVKKKKNRVNWAKYPAKVGKMDQNWGGGKRRNGEGKGKFGKVLLPYQLTCSYRYTARFMVPHGRLLTCGHNSSVDVVGILVDVEAYHISECVLWSSYRVPKGSEFLPKSFYGGQKLVGTM